MLRVYIIIFIKKQKINKYFVNFLVNRQLRSLKQRWVELLFIYDINCIVFVNRAVIDIYFLRDYNKLVTEGQKGDAK